jgi:hypothetical protein
VCRQSVSGELGSEEKCAARPSLSCAPDYPSHPTPPRLSILWPLALPAPPTGGCLAGPPRRSTRPQGQWRWSSGDVSGEVFIGAGRPYGGGYDLARGHLEVGEQTPCAVALILVLLALNGACSHRKLQGCRRSSAWMELFSSVLSRCAPFSYRRKASV